ncbi:MAG TPA: TIR domain-containing protein [Terriglobales bacterium]|nr:TIR domain-containing protein [Terriglobales bacterium]
MARRVFFSFHYKRDVIRANIVKNSWVTQDREDAGFFNSSVFESKQRTSEDALRRFLDDGFFNTTVTCALIGAETAWRRWVRYELFRSVIRGNALLGVTIHNIPNFLKQTDQPGWNPFAVTGFEMVSGMVRFKELQYNALTNKTSWVWSKDFPRGFAPSSIGLDLGARTNTTLEPFAQIYDWNAHNGCYNLGTWVEDAAKRAGH